MSLKITITGERGEGKTKLAKMIELVLKYNGIESKSKYDVKDTISITNSKAVRNCGFNHE